VLLLFVITTDAIKLGDGEENKINEENDLSTTLKRGTKKEN
jgi:hypothetical protein